MKKISFLSAFFTIYGLFSVAILSADTIYTKDGKEIKGIIIEEYKDRVLISTVDGEKSIMKSEVRELYFDTEEQNLIKLAEQARDRGDFIKAFVYYDKAFKINPESRAAKDGIVFLQGYLFKRDMAKKEEDVNRRNDFEKRGGGPVRIKTEEERFLENEKKLRDAVGITIGMVGTETRITGVRASSPAYEAGIRQGDILVAVWGRLVKYLSIHEIVDLMLEKTSLETKCTIEHGVSVGVKNFGAEFKMQFDGMTVSRVQDGSSAKEAGLKEQDIITAINGNSTRYMPLKKALELIKNSANDTVMLTFRRDLVIWGKEGG
jgi:hypothetical protein